MVTFLALLPSLAHAQVPPECAGGGSGPAVACASFGPCTLDISGTDEANPACLPVTGRTNRIVVEGNGVLHIYNATGNDTHRIDGLDVSDEAVVYVWDDSIDDMRVSLRIRGTREAPSVTVDDAELVLQNTRVQGPVLGVTEEVERGAAIHVGGTGEVMMTDGEVKDGLSRLGAVFIDEAAKGAFIGTDFAENLFHFASFAPHKGRDVYSVGDLYMAGTTHTASGVAVWEGMGGAVFAAGKAVVGQPMNPAVFDGFVAAQGGSIAFGEGENEAGEDVECGTMEAFATITNSDALDAGGAVWARDCEDVTIADSSFTNTYAANEGGAAWLSNLGVARIDRTTFTNTGAYVSRGGAVYLEDVDDGVIDRASFEWTFAGIRGGGLHAVQSNVEVSNSRFMGTSSDFSDGSAISAAADSSVSVEGSVFCETGQGGTAIDGVGPDTTVDIAHSWFEGTGTLKAGGGGGTADHITVVSPANTLFGGGPWTITHSIVGRTSNPAGVPSVDPDNLWVRASSAPAGATVGELTLQTNVDGLRACEGNFRLLPEGTHPSAVGVPEDPTDDWGAFALDVGEDRLRRVGAGDEVDWGEDADGDGWPNALDCAFDDAAIHPGADEVCDGDDNDCDGLVDDADLSLDGLDWYPDVDEDTFGNDAGRVEQCARPAMGSWTLQPGDCDDANGDVNPAALERCGNGNDDDCDGLLDGADDNLDPSGVNGADLVYLDNDADGYPENPLPDARFLICPDDREGIHIDAPAVPGLGDCDDSDDTIHEGATEVCDGKDNDCDGAIDGLDGSMMEEVDPADLWAFDNDGDGYTVDAGAIGWCSDAPPPGDYVPASLESDCDDNESTVFPGADETCDELDNNCDSLVDTEDPFLQGDGDYWLDLDGDGQGGGDRAEWCFLDLNAFAIPEWPDARLLEQESDPEDCDDTDPLRFHGNVEVCGDGIDNDCDPATPDVAVTYFADEDNDGYGDAEQPFTGCISDVPPDYVDNDLDCDDSTNLRNPGLEEVCNDDLDNDCDDTTGDLDGADFWYEDADDDGLGNPSRSIDVCGGDEAEGYVTNADDCDDDDGDVGLPEPFYPDRDDDGFGDENAGPESMCPDKAMAAQEPPYSTDATDCRDDNPAIHPGAPEVVDNGIDEDCNGSDTQSWVAGGCGSCSSSVNTPRSWLGAFGRRR